MAQINLNIISFGICLLCLLFLMIGCIGYASDTDTVKNCAWITVDGGGTTVYYGLKKVAAGSQSSAYSDCGSDACQTCEDSGGAAFAFTFIGTLLCAAACAATGMGAAKPENGRSMGIASIVLIILIIVCTILAMGSFMGACWDKVDDNGADPEWGPGSALVMTSFVFLVITLCIQCAGVFMYKNADNTATTNQV